MNLLPPVPEQALGLCAVGLVGAAAAFAAYAALGGVLCAAGLPAALALSPAAFSAFGLAAMVNPLFVALLPVLLPVRAPFPGVPLA